MKTFASKSQLQKKKPANLLARGVKENSVASGFTYSSAPPIQRKASCACGGGCPTCQAKNSDLKVSRPNDSAEIEADRVADQIMRIPDSSPRPRERSIRDVTDGKDVQRKFIASGVTPSIQMQGINSEEGEIVEDRLSVQRFASGDGGDERNVPGNFLSNLGHGSPLDIQTRSFFEPRFGHDFGDVRIHNGPQADKAAASVEARAFTLGRDVVFAAGEHDPGSEGGKRLLAHELTHVVQQSEENRNQEGIRRGLSVGEKSNTSSTIHTQIARDTQPVLRRVAITRSCTTLSGSCPPDSADEADSLEAFDRIGRTNAGAWLLGQLEALPALQSSTIDAHFASNVTHEVSGVMGSFRPAISGASAYTAFVDLNSQGAGVTALPADADSPLPQPSRPPYGGAGAEVQTYVVERPSLLAETLFHEMLHIWFINTIGTLNLTDRGGAEYGTNLSDPTGHENAAQGEIDSRFLRRLRDFAVDVYRLETDPERLSTEAEARTARGTPLRTTTVDEVSESSSRPVDSEPAPVTFTSGVSVGLGGAPVAGSPFDVPLEAHVGVLFGRAVQFGLRGEAVWFPGSGLVGLGGGIGINVLETESAPGGSSRIAQNPWFFDLEAGAAYLIDVPDPLLLRAGAGIGLEHGGPDEWRVFWRIGGALELNPTPSMLNVGGEGTFTFGVRR